MTSTTYIRSRETSIEAYNELKCGRAQIGKEMQMPQELQAYMILLLHDHPNAAPTPHSLHYQLSQNIENTTEWTEKELIRANNNVLNMLLS
jgi:hypothetical protein